MKSSVKTAKGVITFTKTGLIHTANHVEEDEVQTIKRGRGRPSKQSLADLELKYDFSCFPTVKMPKWKGNSSTHLMDKE